MLLSAAALIAQAAASDLSPAQINQIRHLFAESDTGYTPGAAVLVKRGGRILFREAFGMADLERSVPLSPESRFYVASVSKQITAMCVLLLEREGKLKLDDGVRKHLPELPELAEPITIRHLLNHTSGLRDYYELWDLRGQGIRHNESDRQVLELLARQRELNFKPGAEYSYTNSGYLLAKIIIERTAGRSLRAYAQEKIFGPLGMKDTLFSTSLEEVLPGRALGYQGEVSSGIRGVLNADDLPGPRGVVTTIDDFSLWMDNLKDSRLEGGRGLVQKMLTMGRLADGEPIEYGLGIGESRVRGLRRVGHSGWFAGYRSRVYWYPEIDAQIILFANSTSINPTEIADRICDIAFLDGYTDPKPEPKPPRFETIPFDPEAWKQHIGFHRSDRAEWEDWMLGDEEIAALSRPGDRVVRRLKPVKGGGLWDSAADLHYAWDGKRWVASDRRGVARFWSPLDRRQWTEEQLKAFVGRYRSDELDSVHEVTFSDGRLRHRCGPIEGPLKPVASHTDFDGPFGRVEFTGRRMIISGSRVRRMPFERF